MHAEGAKQNVTVNTVWNPADINYSGADVMSLYPGSHYVDIIGTDSYSPEYALDTTNWASANGGGITSTSGTPSAAQQAINNAHYWTYSNASQYNVEGQAGTGSSMQQAIELAKETGKPLGIAETGTAQDPKFATWLAQELSQPGAPQVAFVNVWSTDQGDGAWGFINGENTAVGQAWRQAFGAGSAANPNGPAVAAAPLDAVPGDSGSVAIAVGSTSWASAFAPAAPPTAAPPTAVTIGTGPDVVSLQLAEDAWQGDAQVAFSVDGTQVSVQTVTASHAAGMLQTVDLQGTWGAGQHTITVAFLNDAYGGSAATDRNAYVGGVSYDGQAASPGTATLLSNGAASFVAGTALPGPTTLGAGPDTVSLSEDAWQGDAQFTLSIDGRQVGGTQTVLASHAAGQHQVFNVAGSFGAGPHTVAVDFLNDAYAGTAATDRNLYVDAATENGVAQAASALSLMSGGTQSFAVTQQDRLVLQVSEDAWQGDAQFTVSVDGRQVGGTQVATASHAAGQSQSVTLSGTWGLGQHTVAVDFLNDAYAGTPSTDRNLYVNSASYDGGTGGGLVLISGGTQSLSVASATTYAPGATGASLATLGNDTVSAGTGAVTVNAMGPSVAVTGSTGSLVFVAHGGSDTVTAGTGNATLTGAAGPLTFFAGSGSAILAAGSGRLLVDLVDGHAGGSLLVNGFVPGTDLVHLQGYAAAAIRSQTVVGGSTLFVLGDGTRLTLVGLATIPATHPVFG